ncbi:MAG: amidohydrolase [Thermoplasmata archaeon]|nr:amidohydrolase [Thermoplasmata archaeon]
MGGGTLFHGGRVFTGHRFVEAVVLDGSRVVAAGTDAEVRRAAPNAADRVDLHGHFVIPGLIDAHLHLSGIALERVGVRLAGVRSEREIVERCTAWAVDHPAGPVIGRGWDQERMEGGTYPTREALDRAFPEREVVLYRVCGHAALVNAPVLSALRVAPSTDDPAGGRIVHDPQGGTTGVLLDEAMTGLGPIRQRALSARPEEADRILLEASSFGLTTVASMSVGAVELRSFAERATSAPPPVRVRFYVDVSARREVSSGPREWAGGLVRLSGVKAISDGSFGAHTAWLSEPYTDRPDEVGFPVGSSDELADEIAIAGELGLQVAIHAIGDRAVYRALRLLQLGYGGPTPRIEHASLLPPNLYPLLDRVRPHLVVQPRFVVSDSWLPERLGAVRARFAYAFRSLSERGYRLAGSSDAPVEPLDPWTGIAAAVHRGDRSIGRWVPAASEQLTAEAAIQLYTVGGGAALEEPGLGSLEVGAPGDLLLLRTDSLERAVEAGRGAVAETWRGGVRVQQNAEPA